MSMDRWAILDFESLTREEAEGFYRSYVAQEASQVEWLRRRSGLDLTPTRTGLADLWAWWIHEREAVVREPSDRQPLWVVREGIEVDVPVVELQVLDCASFLFARALCSAFPDARWHLVTSKKRDEADENQPVVTRDGEMWCNTRVIVVGLGGQLRQIVDGDASEFRGPSRYRAVEPDGLAQLFDAWLTLGL